MSKTSRGEVDSKEPMRHVTSLGIERSVDEVGSTIISHACSHGKPVVRWILPDELVHEQNVDPGSEGTSVVVHRELMNTLLPPSSERPFVASC